MKVKMRVKVKVISRVIATGMSIMILERVVDVRMSILMMNVRVTVDALNNFGENECSDPDQVQGSDSNQVQ